MQRKKEREKERLCQRPEALDLPQAQSLFVVVVPQQIILFEGKHDIFTETCFFFFFSFIM